MIVEFDVPATMRDGTVLRANVYRRGGADPGPVLLCRTPYGKDFPNAGATIDVPEATKRGFVVVIQDTRGRFNSEGDWEPMLNEAEDGADSVAWAATLPGSDGQVAMYGASYFGFTQWAAASQKPPALRAIAPFVTWFDPFDGILFRGGALELGLQASWHMQVGLNSLMRRHKDDKVALGRAVYGLVADYDALPAGFAELPLREFPPLRRHGVGEAFFETVSNPLAQTDRTAVSTAVHTWHDRITVPSFNIGGWHDIFLAGTIANYRAARRAGQPARLLIGPWPHGPATNPIGEINYGFGAQAGFIDLRSDLSSMQLDWFEHRLRDTVGPDPDKPVQVFVMGINKWRTEVDWPLDRAETVPFFLHADGGLSEQESATEQPDRYEYDPADPAPTLGGATLLSPDYPAGPRDQRRVEERPDVLAFTTAPLEQDLEVTGPIELSLWASSSAPDTDFVARLCDVFPDGRSINLTDGIIRARYRNGIGDPQLLEPGRPYEFTIDLWATSNVFLAGHRIRLDITSSSFPRWDRNPNTGHELGADAELRVAQQQIWHDREHPSQLLLPVVPGLSLEADAEQHTDK